MRDSFGRDIDYIRISITDRCNLRCRYCMPQEGVKPLSHSEVLRYEEFLRVANIATKLGIRHFKITGGEPLVRKGCLEFLRDFRRLPGVESLTLTTNAVLLEPLIPDFVRIKIDGINISLDSLSAERYYKITRRDEFSTVWQALVKAVQAGLSVKINCVTLADMPEDEILGFVRLAREMPIGVRFIEFMPSGVEQSIQGICQEKVFSILLREYPDLVQDRQRRGFGPAVYFKSSEMLGSIGMINAVENCFCPGCNRVRLTSDGFLKLCLFCDDGVSLRDMLRDGGSDLEIEKTLVRAILQKPERYQQSSGAGMDAHIKNMSRIGG